MPVFTEQASSSRDLRVLPSFAPPLPRLAPQFESNDKNKDKYETIVVGVCGPLDPIALGSVQSSIFERSDDLTPTI